MPLEVAEEKHLRAAHGYIELGMFEAVNAELEEIDPFLPRATQVSRRCIRALRPRHLRSVRRHSRSPCALHRALQTPVRFRAPQTRPMRCEISSVDELR